MNFRAISEPLQITSRSVCISSFSTVTPKTWITTINYVRINKKSKKSLNIYQLTFQTRYSSSFIVKTASSFDSETAIEIHALLEFQEFWNFRRPLESYYSSQFSSATGGKTPVIYRIRSKSSIIYSTNLIQ